MITLVEQPATIPQWPPEAPIRVTQVDDLDLLWARKAEWNALVERGATNTVFQTCEWHACWWKTLAGDARPFVLLAESAGEMVGVAPLMLSERRVLSRKRRVVEFIGARSSDYCDLIVDQRRPEVLPLLLEWLAEHDQQWDVLQLADIPETSPTLRALPAFFEQRGRLTDVRALYEAPTRIFGDPAADRQLVKKKSLRRHENYFRQHGTLEFKHAV